MPSPDPHAAFRATIRAFLDTELTPDLRTAGRRMTSYFCDPRYSLPWQRILHAKGWAAPAWPAAYGGTGWTEEERVIFAEECARAEAPNLSPMGLRMIGPALIAFGDEDQKARYLPRILSGEDYWCQGYSEPQAGSDLATLTLKAVREGDHYVLDGSKIWTTHAQHANRMFCLARTSQSDKPQRGITFLLLDMAARGITVEPIITLAGEHELNAVFFDQVRVPVTDRLGREDEGWTVAKYLLEFERSGSMAPQLWPQLQRAQALAVPDGEPALRTRLAETEIELLALEATDLRIRAATPAGQSPGAWSSAFKVGDTEMMQRIDALGVEALGPYAQVEQPDARAPETNTSPIGPEAGLVATARYLNNRAASIYGGTNEIQRNVIARALLGL